MYTSATKNLRKETTKEERINKKERKFDKMPVVRIMRLTKRFEEVI